MRFAVPVFLGGVEISVTAQKALRSSRKNNPRWQKGGRLVLPSQPLVGVKRNGGLFMNPEAEPAKSPMPTGTMIAPAF